MASFLLIAGFFLWWGSVIVILFRAQASLCALLGELRDIARKKGSAVDECKIVSCALLLGFGIGGMSVGIWCLSLTFISSQDPGTAEEADRIVASQLTGDEKFFHGKVSAVIRQPTRVVVENRLFSVTEAQTKLLQVGQKVSFIYSEGDENKTTAAVRYIIRSE